MGKLSAEEEQQYREESYRQIGVAIAQRYIDSPQEHGPSSELGGYSEDEKNVIRKAALNHLTEAMDLTSPGKLEVISVGVASLEPKVQSVLEQIVQLAQECEQARMKARRELENRSKETLHRLRISGTAVGSINIETTPEWQQSDQQLMAAFGPRFDTLKQELVLSI